MHSTENLLMEVIEAGFLYGIADFGSIPMILERIESEERASIISANL